MDGLSDSGGEECAGGLFVLVLLQYPVGVGPGALPAGPAFS